MPLKAALRTLHRTPSHHLAIPPIPPAAAKPGPAAKARAGFERSLDLDDWRAAKGSLYSDVTCRVLITASREASYRSGSLARIETKEAAMAILGALLMVAGGAIVLASAILWLWFTSRQKLLSGPDEGSDHPPEVPIS